jgi:hypothetical protein
MMQLWSSMITARVVSPCEAAIQMAGVSMVKKSDTVDSINSYPPDLRSVYVTKNNTSKVLLAPVNWYECRPAPFRDLTFTQLFTQYTLNTTPIKSLGPVLAVDQWNNRYQKRNPDQPVRFSNFNPGVNPEGFFYNMLLDKASLTNH